MARISKPCPLAVDSFGWLQQLRKKAYNKIKICKKRINYCFNIEFIVRGDSYDYFLNPKNVEKINGEVTVSTRK